MISSLGAESLIASATGSGTPFALNSSAYRLWALLFWAGRDQAIIARLEWPRTSITGFPVPTMCSLGTPSRSRFWWARYAGAKCRSAMTQPRGGCSP